MNIEKTVNGESLKIALTGRLDTNTAPELEKVVNESIDGVTDLVFDFEGLDYVSSAGLRILLAASKVMAKQGHMKLVHVNDVIMEVFDMTGFSSILTIED